MRRELAPPATLATPEMEELRGRVRSFLSAEIEAGRFTPWVDTWLTRWDEDFTRRLAERGWVGMTIPREYGGHSRSHLERFVVTEELLAVGAPVAAQWVADRQIAPSLLRYGTEEQKRRYLPRIAAGQCCFGIGMSEPDSGSDLAAVRTRGTRVEGGWSITGTKVWTSGAQHAEAFIALCRTAPLDVSDRHAGLSQFLVDLRSAGVTIRPILSLSGDHHFNEVVMEQVFVPDSMVFGTLGQGWEQVTSELAFERSGPERFLSSFRLFAAAIGAISAGVLPGGADLGRSVARMAGLHALSQNVAGALERGEPADTAAALVKLLGTATEGDLVEAVSQRVGDELSAGSGDPGLLAVTSLLRAGLHQRPGFTLRGGTNEILRGVIARGLGMRADRPGGVAAGRPGQPGPGVDEDLSAMMHEVVARHGGTSGRPAGVPGTSGAGSAEAGQVWRTLCTVGLSRLTAPEESGGGGAGWAEAAELLRLAAAAGVAVPYAETDLVVGPVRRAASLDDSSPGTATLAVLGPGGWSRRVPWAGATDSVLFVRRASTGAHVGSRGPGGAADYEVVEVSTERTTVEAVSGTSAVPLGDVAPPPDAGWVPVGAGAVETAVLRGALARAVQCVGAAEGMLEAALEHTAARTQFGRPLDRFQSVQNLVVDLAAEAVLARAVVDQAIADAVATDLAGPLSSFRVAVARSVVSQAMAVAVRNVHQVHGAIGTTHEHFLHRLTLPALQWRGEYGSAAFWESLLEVAAVAGGEDGAWPLVVGGAELPHAGGSWLDRVTSARAAVAPRRGRGDLGTLGQ